MRILTQTLALSLLLIVPSTSAMGQSITDDKKFLEIIEGLENKISHQDEKLHKYQNDIESLVNRKIASCRIRMTGSSGTNACTDSDYFDLRVGTSWGKISMGSRCGGGSSCVRFDVTCR